MKLWRAFVFTLFILINTYVSVPLSAQIYPMAIFSGLDFIIYKTGKLLLKNHHVKSMTIWSIGNKSIYGFPDGAKEQIIEFDRDGNITGRIIFDRKLEWGRYHYMYNPKGKLVYYELFTRGKPIESITFVLNDLGLSDYSIHCSRNSISDTTHYFWSENYRSAASKRYSPGNNNLDKPSMQYTLDSLQNVIEIEDLHEGDVANRFVNKFNEVGNRVEMITYWRDGREKSIKYLYDSENRLVTMEYSDLKINYMYSVDGLLSESLSTRNNNITTRYSYEFY